MSVRKELFGKMPDGQEIYRFWIENVNGVKTGVINYGAIWVNQIVPDGNGKEQDVILGFDTLEPYFDNDSFLGAVIGPNANRIANASFTLDGKTYQLDVNDGKNNLHSHKDLGYHKKIWDAKEEADGVTFSLTDTDGNMGFPGNKTIQVTYTLSDANEVRIHYHGTSDKKTILNMTNHCYFNLAGHDKGKIYDHVLQLHASRYTPVLSGAIPTGELAKVAGTVFDFTAPKRIGDEIDADNEQLKLTKGYDHNWVIDGADGSLKEIATVKEPVSGRSMKVFSDLPGVQFYAGNCIADQIGKGGTAYGVRSGLCLETQYYPDTANKPEFPSAVFGPEREYDTTTVYQFLI